MLLGRLEGPSKHHGINPLNLHAIDSVADLNLREPHFSPRVRNGVSNDSTSTLCPAIFLPLAISDGLRTPSAARHADKGKRQVLQGRLCSQAHPARQQGNSLRPVSIALNLHSTLPHCKTQNRARRRTIHLNFQDLAVFNRNYLHRFIPPATRELSSARSFSNESMRCQMIPFRCTVRIAAHDIIEAAAVAHRELGTIERVSPEGNLGLRLVSGREGRFNTREHLHLDQGYALTSQSSQGLVAILAISTLRVDNSMKHDDEPLYQCSTHGQVNWAVPTTLGHDAILLYIGIGHGGGGPEDGSGTDAATE